MQQIYRNIVKDGSGVVKLICEEPEDMWHLFNIIRVGDKVRSKTLRKVIKESETRPKTSQRMLMTLEVDIETIDFDTMACSLHLKGRNTLENEHVKCGAYHTIDLEMNRPFSLSKRVWDYVDIQRLNEALDKTRNADVAAVIMHEGLANICVLTSNMTISKAKIDMSIAQKRKGFSNQHDKAVTKFLDAVSQSFLRHINMETIKCVIIASPGDLRTQFVTHLFAYADKQNQRLSTSDRSKFVNVRSSTGFKHALKEILADPAISTRLANTKAQAEVKALNRFMELLNADTFRAFYGFKHVSLANEELAIDTLMVSDSLFRSSDIAQRRQYVDLVESVRYQGGNVLIFSSMHISGEQLNQLTGVAAILRYPLPEIEDDDEKIKELNFTESALGTLHIGN